MPKHPFSSSPLRRAVLIAIAGLMAAAHARAQYDPDWARNFRFGVLTGFNIKADFRTRPGTFGIPGSDPGPVGVSGVDHVYDDGYVRVDDFGNAGGYTTFWGYENAGQYDPNSHTIQFHSSHAYSVGGSSATQDDSPYFGMDLAYGGVIRRWQKTRLGWEFGFGFLPMHMSDRQTTGAAVHQVTHSFEVPAGVVVPTAPYQGGPSGYGQPSIFDVATEVDAGSTNGVVSSSTSLDVTLFAFRLGPTLFLDLSPDVGLAFGAGPALGIVTGDYTFDDRIEVGTATVRNRGRFSETDVVFGGYVSAVLTYHAVQNGDLYLGVQYMPLGSTKFSRGGREATLDLSGAVYVSAGFNWPF